MFMITVVDPDCFDARHFESSDTTTSKQYRDELITFLRGIRTNCQIVVDKDEELKKEILVRLQGVQDKYRQRLLIPLEDAMKSGHCFVSCSTSCAPRSADRLDLETLVDIFRAVSADAIVLHSSRDNSLDGLNIDKHDLVHADAYISTEFEDRRLNIYNPPALETCNRVQIDDYLRRVMYLSPWLEFYDPYINKSNQPREFVDGIAYILRIWKKHYRGTMESRRVRIYTVAREHGSRNNDAQHVRNKIVNPLQAEFPSMQFEWHIKVAERDEERELVHDRFLRTKSTILNFSRGFDFLITKNSRQRDEFNPKPCIVAPHTGSSKTLTLWQDLPELCE